jgi:hypothetical protein
MPRAPRLLPYFLPLLLQFGCDRTDDQRLAALETSRGFQGEMRSMADFSTDEVGQAGWPAVTNGFSRGKSIRQSWYEVKLEPLDARETLLREAVDRANAGTSIDRKTVLRDAPAMIDESLRGRKIPEWWKGVNSPRRLLLQSYGGRQAIVCLDPATTYVWVFTP